MKSAGIVPARFDVFICHKRSDGQAIALALREYLRRGKRFVFLDVTERQPGEFAPQLFKSIEHARQFLVVATPEVLRTVDNESDWVKKEILYAKATEKPVWCLNASDVAALGYLGSPDIMLEMQRVIPLETANYYRTLRSVARAIPSSLWSRIRWVAWVIWPHMVAPAALALFLLTIIMGVNRLERDAQPLLRAGKGLQKTIQERSSAVESLKDEIRRLQEGTNKPCFFLLDTTGSMIRKRWLVVRRVEQLFRERPQIGESIVVLFSDHNEEYTVSLAIRTNVASSVVRTIEGVPSTGGGDDPEALEDALHFVNEYSQREGMTDFNVVVFTDARAHSVAECPHRYDWRMEVAQIEKERGKILVVDCGGDGVVREEWRAFVGVTVEDLFLR